jgi:hypothetical protein
MLLGSAYVVHMLHFIDRKGQKHYLIESADIKELLETMQRAWREANKTK